MNLFRFTLCIVAFSVIPVAVVAQIKPTDPDQRLEELGAATSLDRPGVKPWHLHMNFVLSSLDGKSTENGTVEEWFISPHQYKVVIDSPSLKQTIPGTKPLEPAQRREAFLVDLLIREVVHPVSGSLLAAGLKVTDAPVTYSGAKLECLSVFRPLKDEMGDPALLPGPKFCMQPDSNTLRMAFEEGDLSVVRNKLGAFLGTQLALENSISLNGLPAISGTVDKLEALDPQKVSIDTLSESTQPLSFVPSVVVTGKALVHDPPPIPVGAAANHLYGTVVLGIRIDKQGKVNDVTVISSPNTMIAGAAVNSIGLWTYSPFLVNGSVADIHSVVTVNFGAADGGGKRR